MPITAVFFRWRFVVMLVGLVSSVVAHGHGIAGTDAAFVAHNQGVQIIPFMYLNRSSR